MRIQCGECHKFYSIDAEKIPEKGASFTCKNCGNKLTINANQTLTSGSGNSKIACSNCGQLLHEDIRKCDNCNLKVNKIHEDLRIDNNYYENLNLDSRGNITGNVSGGRKKVIVSCSVGMVCLISVALGYYYYQDGTIMLDGGKPVISQGQKEERGSSENKTKVVILKNGDTLYASDVKKDGLYYAVTGVNGMVLEVKIDDVLQISQAVVNREK